jgi:hypothetical protein
MSVSLYVIPVQPESFHGVVPGRELSFVSDYRIFGQLADLGSRRSRDSEIPTQSIPTYPIPPGMMVEHCGKLINTDSVGNPIVYTTIDQMKKIVLPKEVSPINRAVMAYIKALPDNWAIILVWSW